MNSITEGLHSYDVLISLRRLPCTAGWAHTVVFFHYQKFPHNATAEKTTPPGVQRQESGCFKTPTRPSINPESTVLIQLFLS